MSKINIQLCTETNTIRVSADDHVFYHLEGEVDDYLSLIRRDSYNKRTDIFELPDNVFKILEEKGII